MPNYILMQIPRILVRSLAAVVLAGIVLLQPLPAGEAWSKVKKIKEGTRVYVYLPDEKYEEGPFVGADDSVMNVRVAGKGVIPLERDLVLQVAVDHGGSHWYTVPLTIAAAVAGGAAGYGIAERTRCVNNGSAECKKGKGVIVGGLAVGSGAVAYTLTRPKRGRKVIYVRGR
jgi:hypothetical protein